jgi:hypothetical protein
MNGRRRPYGRPHAVNPTPPRTASGKIRPTVVRGSVTASTIGDR